MSLWLALAAAFYLAPIATGDDWQAYRAASWHLLRGEPLYQAVYVSPPHVALLLTPLALWPERVGFALLNGLSFVSLLLLAERYQLSHMQTLALAFSPPLTHIALHGQIDVLIVGALLLPSWLWLLAAISKPQTAMGLILHPTRGGFLLIALMLAINFAIAPNWVMDILVAGGGLLAARWNILADLWPHTIVLAVLLLLTGRDQNDERWLLGASPLLLPYAAFSSLISPWLLACSRLSDRYVLITWLTWWGIIFGRVIADYARA